MGKSGRNESAKTAEQVGERQTLTVAAAETSCFDLDLNMALLWGPKGALLDAEVAGTVEGDGCLGAEDRGRHG